MPIRIDANLPAKKILEHENIFVMDYERSMRQDIRPLRIVIMNLMPTKEETELQLLRSLANTPLQVDISFLKTEMHNAKNVSANHLEAFYTTFSEIKDDYYDGLIITGAPVETLEYEDVDYWPELVAVMEWSKTHVTSTFHICWAAQAGLYYHYGVRKYLLDEKDFRHLQTPDHPQKDSAGARLRRRIQRAALPPLRHRPGGRGEQSGPHHPGRLRGGRPVHHHRQGRPSDLRDRPPGIRRGHPRPGISPRSGKRHGQRAVPAGILQRRQPGLRPGQILALPRQHPVYPTGSTTMYTR